jgi:hypothetical protein
MTGVIGYELGGHEHGSVHSSVTLLPPHVPHDGHSVGASGFLKRVLYLEPDLVSGIGQAVDRPTIADTQLRNHIDHLHHVLATPGGEFEAGFHDQSHLNRHFKKMIGATPGRFAGVRR